MTYKEAKRLQLKPTGELRSFQTALSKMSTTLDLISQKAKTLKSVAKHDSGVLDCDESHKSEQTKFLNSRQAWNVFAMIEDALYRLEIAQLD